MTLSPSTFSSVLVFYDDGFAQYTTLDRVHLVCESGSGLANSNHLRTFSLFLTLGCNIWEEVAKHSREFIQRYLDSYPIVSSLFVSCIKCMHVCILLYLFCALINL